MPVWVEVDARPLVAEAGDLLPRGLSVGADHRGVGEVDGPGLHRAAVPAADLHRGARQIALGRSEREGAQPGSRRDLLVVRGIAVGVRRPAEHRAVHGVGGVTLHVERPAPRLARRERDGVGDDDALQLLVRRVQSGAEARDLGRVDLRCRVDDPALVQPGHRRLDHCAGADAARPRLGARVRHLELERERRRAADGQRTAEGGRQAGDVADRHDRVPDDLGVGRRGAGRGGRHRRGRLPGQGPEDPGTDDHGHHGGDAGQLAAALLRHAAADGADTVGGGWRTGAALVQQVAELVLGERHVNAPRPSWSARQWSWGRRKRASSRRAGWRGPCSPGSSRCRR